VESLRLGFLPVGHFSPEGALITEGNEGNKAEHAWRKNSVFSVISCSDKMNGALERACSKAFLQEQTEAAEVKQA
jgi:hypothetical protein